MKIGSEKFNNDNKKNYVCIEDYDPQLLVEESTESLQEFVKNHWDIVKEEVNNFTMERYGFRSEPTIVEKTGQAQSPAGVFVKSLEHENLIFWMPAGYNNEEGSFGLSRYESDLSATDNAIIAYLISCAYKDDLKPLNDALQSFIKEKSMYNYSEGLQEKLGCRSEFRVVSLVLAGLENKEEVKNELLQYFKNVKYENYSADEIKSIINSVCDGYSTEEDKRYVIANVYVYNDYDKLDTKILEEFVNYCKNKGLQVPAFRFTILNNYKMRMYTRGSVSEETSRVVFNNKFEITFSSNSDEYIESIKELWGNEDKKEVKRW